MFNSIEELPDSIRKTMPAEAQKLYRAVYNRVVEKATMAAAKDEPDVAATAHDTAMLAVQAEFRRDESGRWQRQPIGAQMDDKGPRHGR